MSDPLDLILDDPEAVVKGVIGRKIKITDTEHIRVQASFCGASQLFLYLEEPDGGDGDAGRHISNEQAIALGLALIQCAKEIRETQT